MRSPAAPPQPSPSALPTLLPRPAAAAAAAAPGLLLPPYTSTTAACQPDALSCWRRSAMMACRLPRLPPSRFPGEPAAAAAAAAAATAGMAGSATPTAAPLLPLPLLPAAGRLGLPLRAPSDCCTVLRCACACSCCKPGSRCSCSSRAATACLTWGMRSYRMCPTAAAISGAKFCSAASPCCCPCCAWAATPGAAAGPPSASSVCTSAASVSAAALRTCHSLRCMAWPHNRRMPAKAAALRREPSRATHDCTGSSTSPADSARAPEPRMESTIRIVSVHAGCRRRRWGAQRLECMLHAQQPAPQAARTHLCW